MTQESFSVGQDEEGEEELDHEEDFEMASPEAVLGCSTVDG